MPAKQDEPAPLRDEQEATKEKAAASEPASGPARPEPARPRRAREKPTPEPAENPEPEPPFPPREEQHTPLYTYPLLNEDAGCEAHFKLESLGPLHDMSARMYASLARDLIVRATPADIPLVEPHFICLRPGTEDQPLRKILLPLMVALRVEGARVCLDLSVAIKSQSWGSDERPELAGLTIADFYTIYGMESINGCGFCRGRNCSHIFVLCDEGAEPPPPSEADMRAKTGRRRVEPVIEILTADTLRAAARATVDLVMKEALEQAKVPPAHVVVPWRYSLADPCDLALLVSDALSRMAPQARLVVAQAEGEAPTGSAAPDRAWWIQNYAAELTLGQYVASCASLDDNVGTVSEDALLDALPENLLPDVSDIQRPHRSWPVEIFRGVAAEALGAQQRFRGPEPSVPKDALVLRVPVHGSRLAFLKFLSVSHTCALGCSLDAVAAVVGGAPGAPWSSLAGKKDAKRQSVFCLVPAAAEVPCAQNDVAFAIQDQLEDSLAEQGQSCSFRVRGKGPREAFLPTLSGILARHKLSLLQLDLGDSEEISATAGAGQTVCKGLSSVIHGAVRVFAPGKEAVEAAVKDLEEAFGKGCVEGLEPLGDPLPSAPTPSVDYSSSHADEPFLFHALTRQSEVTVDGVEKARERLLKAGAVHPTPVVLSHTYRQLARGHQVVLICENLQQTGSFKIRGASNMLLKAQEQALSQKTKVPGVVACSAGNHAQGVSKTAQLLGIPCTIVCPTTAPQVKLQNTLRYGAEVLKEGAVFDQANAFSQKVCSDRGWLFVPPYDGFDVIEGQATIASELLRGLPRDIETLDTVLVNVGGGGMISGIALYLKALNPRIRIIGVQAEKVFPLRRYIRNGSFAAVDRSAGTIADGCNVKTPGGVHSGVLRRLVDSYVCVRENEIAATIVHALVRTYTLSEGGGCMGLAALMSNRLRLIRGERIGVVLCGGNIDLPRVRAVYRFGLQALGKALSFEYRASDTTASVVELAEIVRRRASEVSFLQHVRAPCYAAVASEDLQDARDAAMVVARQAREPREYESRRADSDADSDYVPRHRGRYRPYFNPATVKTAQAVVDTIPKPVDWDQVLLRVRVRTPGPVAAAALREDILAAHPDASFFGID